MVTIQKIIVDGYQEKKILVELIKGGNNQVNTSEKELPQDIKKRASKYIVLTGDPDIDKASIKALEELRKLVKAGKSNDKIKYALPECFKTSLVWTINMRSLRNFLELRTSKAALWEIRELAYNLYNQLPVEHKFMYSDIIKEGE